MKPIKNISIFILLILFSGFTFAQEKKEDKSKELEHIYNGNAEQKDNDFVNAEAEYRKAINENPVNSISKFNLGNAYYKNNKNKEALIRYNQAQKVATSKTDKQSAFHNIGNSFMKEKKYNEAIEAYKQALRNNPKDDETRYNLALAKKLKEEQDKNQNQNKDNKDDKKDNEDKEKDKDKKDQDKKDEEKKEDDKKEDEKNDKGDEKDDKKPSEPQQMQMSPEQMQRLLEAIENQEQDTQKKLNKQKGVKVQSEKDW